MGGVLTTEQMTRDPQGWSSGPAVCTPRPHHSFSVDSYPTRAIISPGRELNLLQSRVTLQQALQGTPHPAERRGGAPLAPTPTLTGALTPTGTTQSAGQVAAIARAAQLALLARRLGRTESIGGKLPLYS
jgi:hypothetical protein